MAKKTKAAPPPREVLLGLTPQEMLKDPKLRAFPVECFLAYRAVLPLELFESAPREVVRERFFAVRELARKAATRLRRGLPDRTLQLFACETAAWALVHEQDIRWRELNDRQGVRLQEQATLPSPRAEEALEAAFRFARGEIAEPEALPQRKGLWAYGGASIAIYRCLNIPGNGAATRGARAAREVGRLVEEMGTAQPPLHALAWLVAARGFQVDRLLALHAAQAGEGRLL